MHSCLQFYFFNLFFYTSYSIWQTGQVQNHYYPLQVEMGTAVPVVPAFYLNNQELSCVSVFLWFIYLILWFLHFSWLKITTWFILIECDLLKGVRVLKSQKIRIMKLQHLINEYSWVTPGKHCDCNKETLRPNYGGSSSIRC